MGATVLNRITSQVETGQADFGLLPIENTSSGSINEVFDLLQHAQVSIVGEVTHVVEHCLLASPGTAIKDITKIYAHPQPFAQCSRYLQGLGNVQHETCDSTSSALVNALETEHSAAIGSAQAGKKVGLEVLKSSIANQAENHSRFIVVSRKSLQVSTQNPNENNTDNGDKTPSRLSRGCLNGIQATQHKHGKTGITPCPGQSLGRSFLC